MSATQAAAFLAAAKSLDLKAELHADYSGRGMFGEKTTAVVVRSQMSARTIARKCGLTVRTDSLGHDTIAY